jgi:AGCS family alanine or glycine:cation symporter
MAYELVHSIGSWVWGPITVILLVGTGLYLTVRLGFIQLLRLWLSLKIASSVDAEQIQDGDLSQFAALTLALSAAIGNGNIAGVATAIALGGPGAVLGMATVYASTTLALMFRQYEPARGYLGGPMYYIEYGLGPRWKIMAKMFAFCTVLAAFGTGNMVEANSVADTLEFSLRDVLGYSSAPESIFAVKLTIGVAYASLVWIVIVGGVKRIGHAVSRLVPLMFLIYVGSSLVVLILNADAVPAALALIVTDAFSGTAAVGGFAGAGVMTVIQFGVARGVFSNEAGLGTTPMAMSAARTREPVRAGLVAMNGPLFDTLIVCTLTALVILTTGVWQSGVSGSELTTMAFNAAVPDLGKVAVSVSLLFFSFSSAVGWSYYGDRGTGYLFGEKAIRKYRHLFCILMPIGAVMKLELVWGLCDIANGLMAVPNLIAILVLSPLVVKETRRYFSSPPHRSQG